MKNYDEMAKDVFRRIYEYENEQKLKRKRMFQTVVPLCCVCLIVFALAGIGVWKNGWFHTGLPETTDPNTTMQTTPEASGGKAELPPMTMLVPESATAGEFAGDMHRPEGFHKNIGSALALKMMVVDDPDYQFRVVTYTYNGDMEEIVAGANQKLDAEGKIDFYTFRTIVMVNEHTGGRVEEHPWSMYFCTLTAEQIYALAEAGAICGYVGSGESNVDVDWTTRAGIDAFCELYGDMNVMGDNENQLKSYPDLWTE